MYDYQRKGRVFFKEEKRISLIVVVIHSAKEHYSSIGVCTKAEKEKGIEREVEKETGREKTKERKGESYDCKRKGKTWYQRKGNL